MIAMIRTRVTTRDNGLLLRISTAARNIRGGVRVGFWENQGNHGGRTPITINTLATIHTKGLGHNPKREFVLPALKQNSESYKQLMKRQLSPLMQNRMSLQGVWQLIGTKAVADVQRYMTTATFTPLKPETIRRKGSSKPLIDTGRLRQSITYKVK